MKLLQKDVGRWVIVQNLNGYILSVDEDKTAAVVRFFVDGHQYDRTAQFEEVQANNKTNLQIQDLLELQELALETDDREWFEQLGKQIAKFKVEF
ncbi:hypothetical protein JFL43_18805 [Viridibacillus sp. YIM B01967]|uniref:IDEAL domain-containing protein n=1 Tax=Viridibacillus soli TaxID=2798301 RepID=A0ABS1HC91_9BACL|nr:hypothetical protein [Viridibacillus soli]MBK3496874.1 hypothetical protein [Viridibacillus soli]